MFTVISFFPSYLCEVVFKLTGGGACLAYDGLQGLLPHGYSRQNMPSPRGVPVSHSAQVFCSFTVFSLGLFSSFFCMLKSLDVILKKI